MLKGHYGQYYEAIFFDQYERALPGLDQDYVGYIYDPDGRQVRPGRQLLHARAAAASTRVYGVDPDIKHPRVDEWTAGFERELTKDVRLSVTGIWRQDKNIQALGLPRRALDARPRSTERPHRRQPITVYNWANRAASQTNAHPHERRTASSTATRTATSSAPPGPSASTRR